MTSRPLFRLFDCEDASEPDFACELVRLTVGFLNIKELGLGRRIGPAAINPQAAFNFVEVTEITQTTFCSDERNFPMKASFLFGLTATLFFLFQATASAQLSYSLSDGGISRGVVRNVAGRVANRAENVIPSWDRSGRFNRDANYEYNQTRLLGGLFAPDFELTASAFGGWNRIVGFGPDSDGDHIFDDDFAVGFAYGRRHSKRLRSEFEFTYRSNEREAPEVSILPVPGPLWGKVDVYSIMKNFVIDIETPSRFTTPYVGIGIGYANVDVDFNRSSAVELENSSTFAWQPIGGVSLQLTERFNYYVEYRYFSTTDLKLTQAGVAQENSTYNAHNLFMGLRAEF